MINIFLEREDIKVEKVNVQKEEKSPLKGGRDVILDIHAVDSSGRHYDIEIQRADSGASSKRARFHSSVIDSRMLKSGQDFTKMNDSYVIFITENDVMGNGLAIYHVDRTIRELGFDSFNDGNHILYVNGAYRGDSKIGLLMKDFACNKADDMHYEVLKEGMQHFKSVGKRRVAMCEKLERYCAEREKAVKIKSEMIGEKRGEKEGEKKGEAKTRIENAKKMIALGKLSLEDISICSGLSLSEVKELIS